MEESLQAVASDTDADTFWAGPCLHPLIAAAIGLGAGEASGASGPTLFTGVPPVLARHVAPAVRPVVERASRYRDFAWHDLEPELVTGRMQLWIAGRPGQLEMACITEVQDRPRAKVGVIVYIAGAHRERWVGFLPLLEQWMREQGCVRIEAWCRRGWERVLTRYRKTHVLMEKPL